MINNLENPSKTNLWTVGVLVWQTALPWYYPNFTRINNLEE